MMETFSQNAAPGERRTPAGASTFVVPQKRRRRELLPSGSQNMFNTNTNLPRSSIQLSQPRIDCSKMDCREEPTVHRSRRRKEMKAKYLSVVMLAVTMATSALAQTQPKPPSPSEVAKHKVKTLTTLLTLTSAQQQQATTIYTNAAQSEQTVMQGEKETHDSLRAAIKSNDSATIDQVAATMAQSMAQLTSIKAKADAAFYQILTPDQQTKLNDLESQHMSPLDGPGGLGGPPPAMGFR
jgi:Spy/CpxP family protein refolding chaperone